MAIAEADKLGVKIAQALELDPERTTYIHLKFEPSSMVVAEVGYIVHKGELDNIDWEEMVPADVTVNPVEVG